MISVKWELTPEEFAVLQDVFNKGYGEMLRDGDAPADYELLKAATAIYERIEAIFLEQGGMS